MKNFIYYIVALCLLVSCAPSSEEIAAQTHAAYTAIADLWTETPTQTSTPTTTPIPTATPTPKTQAGRIQPIPYDQYDSSGDIISPYIFGTVYWWVSPSNPWPDDVLQKFSNNRISIIRMGASSAELIHSSKRNIDEFIRLCKEIGAEPMLQVQLLNKSPDEAASVVEYVNITKEYGVRFWGIGNEPDIWQDSGKKPNYSVNDFNRDWRAFALAMKEVDPNIILLGPDYSWKWRDINSPNDWITPFVKTNGDLLDVISVHFYPSTSAKNVSINQILLTPNEFERDIQALANQLSRISDKPLPIAVTEFNITWDWEATGDNSAKSYWAGLWTADMYGRMINNHVYIANFWSGSGGGLSLLDDKGSPRATFYAQSFYSNYGSVRLPAQTKNKNISIYASQIPDTNYITSVIVNRSNSLESPTLSLNLGGAELSIDHQQATNYELSLPLYSITLIIIDDTLSIARQMVYTKDLWNTKRAPQITD
jgi:hypothetical protein